MSPSWNERRLITRVKPGDGRPLKPFRWWQMTRRSVMSIALPVDGRQVLHTIEVKHGGDLETGVVTAGLYLDGQLRAQSKVPARFPVTHGHIEVRTSQVGLRRCHFVGHDGTERHLVPDPKPAEGRRLRFADAHPLASGLISAVSVLVLLIGVGLNMLQAAEPISEIPFIAGTFGLFESPFHLPMWLNLTLGFGAVLGAMERAMHMRHHWLLDGGAGT
ncbi:MAG: hypothetical protein E6R06_26290 [Mycobacterium sp.]|nr:MAG: hypothetical protein E6R06_26290 [Mycobacterium sp.]